ncbi:ribosomal RNA small subunit methyltransferase A [Candidatus Uhrbacteria bacterium RIFCSPHIGHO2_01_FULL_63_20]|uniref:Ribosomal RNA small subunit methyltransferase A n=1 Tax=Candidatus Uhrbacteria bacterium RIFCSPHIGHO2_01_FULL_63_20 TaxID=1802385 RepID=A0A1F7TLQ6_9BACT|nr:MAG: ribosomal RNA small subunit methyltransferase A [Candidatus Uhrbacteria bacterium RIFCSPHIGHO2_01_FULL_63_20]
MFPRAKKSFGQNFLADPTVLAKIVAAAEIQPGETVLEIGPGTGVLTQALLDTGAKVVAVEADHDLIPALRETFGDRITLIDGDVLTTPYPLPPTPYKLVANIPYNITSDVLHRFLTAEPRPIHMVLMVQREVADRITAAPPDMGLLSVVCQMYADVRKVANVPRGAFRPSPKVDSAVVRLDVRSGDRRRGTPDRGPERSEDTQGGGGAGQDPTVHPEEVIALAKAGFSRPRKQLHGNLVAAGYGNSEEIKQKLSSLGLDPKARAENLRVDDWMALAQALSVL